MSSAINYTIALVQGETFDLPIFFEDDAGAPVDITGRTFTGAIRENREEGAPVYLDLGPLVSIVDAAGGEALLLIPASVATATVSEFGQFNGQYDLFWHAGATSRRFLKDNATGEYTTAGA